MNLVSSFSLSPTLCIYLRGRCCVVVRRRYTTALSKTGRNCKTQDLFQDLALLGTARLLYSFIILARCLDLD